MSDKCLLRVTLFALLLGARSAAEAQTPPSSLSAAAVSTSEIALRWSDTNGSNVSYSIERSLSATSGFVSVAAVGRNATTYRDSRLPSATRYYFRLRAVRPNGAASAYSNVASATTLGVAGTTSSTVTTTTRASATSTTSPPPSGPVANAGPDQLTQTLTTVTFSGSGSFDSGGVITAYAWKFGDGGTASGLSVSHTYGAPGIYTVTLSVTDSRGLTSSDTAIASVSNRAPLANAGPDQSASVGGVVTFSGSASDIDGAVISYGWTFGDGASANGAAATHAYAVAGTYTAKLTVTDDRGATGSDTAVVSVGIPSAGGQVRWGKVLGAGNHYAYGVAVDSGGNVVMTGQAQGPADLGGGVRCPNFPDSNIFIVKYSTTGAWMWTRCMGGGVGRGTGYGVAVDKSDNIVVTGQFMNTIDFGGGAFTTVGPSNDIFVAKYSPAGTHLWSKRFGSSLLTMAEAGYAAAVDANGDVFVAGAFDGTADFGGGPLTSANGTDADAFLVKLSGTNGSHLWSRRFGGAQWDDAAYGVAVDVVGAVVVTGAFGGTADFGGGALSAADLDVFLAKYTAAGSPVWSKRFGSSGSRDQGNGVGIDGSGNVLLAGSFHGIADFGGGPLFASGGDDIFLAKFSATGTPVWSKRIGSYYTDEANGIAVDTTGDVVVVGSFGGTVDFGAGFLSGDTSEIFLAKYSAAGMALWAKRFGGPGWDEGHAVAVNATGIGALAGASFATTIELGAGPVPSVGGAALLSFTP